MEENHALDSESDSDSRPRVGVVAAYCPFSIYRGSLGVKLDDKINPKMCYFYC